MDEVNQQQDWQQVDARILGQILAAQNILFVLPDKTRIAEFFSQVLSSVPGISSCFVCLGNQIAQAGAPYEGCSECAIFRKKEDGLLIMPNNFSCGLASRQNIRIITLKTIEHIFGFFIFHTDSTNDIKPYWPFLQNLANFVSLSLENRMQKNLLEKSYNDLEDKVKERTSELLIVNTQLEEEIEVRKSTEKALKQSEDQFKFLFETMVQGIIIQDAESKILEANNAACEILGLSRDQLLGKTAYDPRWKLIHEDGSPLFPDEMPSNIALRTCKPVTDILIGAYIPEKDTYHWILTSSTPKFKDDDSRPYLTMTTFSNITERRNAEEALSKSEQEFRALSENSPDVIVRYNRQGRRIYVNPEFERVNRLSSQEVLGKTPIELSTELAPMASVFTEKLMAAMASGKIDKIDLLWTKDGKPMCWFVRIVPEFDTNGMVVSALTIWNDISERKQAEAALSKTTDRLNEAQRIGHIGSWELDILNNLLTWSDEIYQMFEIDPKQFGASYEAFLNAIHPDDREKVDFAYSNSLKTNTPYSIDHRLLFADGRIKYVQEQCETFYDCDGKPIRSVGIVQDITDRKKAEEEIQKLNQKLEQRVSERTAQLEAANKELEAFAYSVSHDLRAPLRSIDGFSQALLDEYQDKVGEQGRTYLQRVRVATQRMAQLIDDMLNLSRISRTEMNISQVNLSKIAKEVADELCEAQPDREVEIIIQDEIKVLGDSHLLRVVLENLFVNAWKYTSKHASAHIEFGVQQQDGKPVYFIRDDGAGFEMKYAQKLFGAFQRLHTASEFPGTGIGLATVQRIIHRHGGNVWAEAEVENGATFYFTIP
jgi:PAS domain S-box-containing protein